MNEKNTAVVSVFGFYLVIFVANMHTMVRTSLVFSIILPRCAAVLAEQMNCTDKRHFFKVSYTLKGGE